MAISAKEDSRGFVFATTGESYTTLARRAARTLRQHMPDCQIDLFTNQQVEDEVFNQIHSLDHGWFRPKMQALRESRFDRTVVLDADIVVLAPLEELLDVLDGCDIAGVEGFGRQKPMMPNSLGVPRALPSINTGVLAVKSSERLAEAMREWERRVKENASRIDQPYFREMLFNKRDLRFLPLGAEYNLLSLSRLDHWEKIQGAPRVLHVRDLHDRPAGDPMTPFDLVESVGQERATIVRRLMAQDWSLGVEVTIEEEPSQKHTRKKAKRVQETPRKNLGLFKKLIHSARRELGLSYPALFEPKSKPSVKRKTVVKKTESKASLTHYQTAVLSLAVTGKTLRICMVGANEGQMGGPLLRVISKHLAKKSELILFEPQKLLLPFLSQHFAFHPNNHIINESVGEEGNLTLFAVSDAHWLELQPGYAKKWPTYRAPTRATSANRERVIAWVSKFAPKSLEPSDAVIEINVPCGPLVTALERRSLSTDLDVLQIGAEGFGDQVLYHSDIERTKPSVIFLEYKRMPQDRVERLRSYLEKSYVVNLIRGDLLAVRLPGV